MVEQQRLPVGIRFKEAGKVYYFDCRGFDLAVGNFVVVETSHGQEVGRVVVSPDQVVASEIKETLKPILRLAEQDDLERMEARKKGAQEKVAAARRRVEEEGLQMRIVSGDFNLDASQLTFYFTAEDRVDFRTLSRKLSTEFDTKVQLLQIGERDRAKIVDGIGRCGERLCCSSWLTVFPTVSIRQAKEQDLPLNPSKLSGACGRLLCCLTYEYDLYREIKGGLPKVGAKISTPTGEAKVLKINVPKETINLFILESAETVEMPLDQFRLMYGTALRPKDATEKFEKDLMASEGKPDGAPSAAVAERPSGPPQQRPARPPQGEGAPADGAPRRRRRRRGGRRRRKGPPA